MNKKQAKKLELKKKQIVTLLQQKDIAGGFTYALSLGQDCRYSQKLGARNRVECEDAQCVDIYV